MLPSCGSSGNCCEQAVEARGQPHIPYTQTLSPRELWHLVHQCYGSELGLTSEDEDYVCPLQLNGLG